MSPPPQSRITLPTGSLIGVAIGGPALAALCWIAASFVGTWGESGRLPGLYAIAATAVVSTLTVIAIRPGKPRPILVWGGVLIAASTARIVASIGACLLLYSAARLPAGPLLIGAMAGLVPVLVGETTLATRRFRRDGT
ncbi:MAG: hypothetical protein QF733_03880 [Phycisphaerales bacterium]|jgi:hypothetical protein|nr:hypothetical protein [Phycisphaerales bacterium]